MNCHICYAPGLTPIEMAEKQFRLVASDVQVVDGYVQWAVCSQCLTIQKVLDDRWQRMVAAIYEHYDINHQSAGNEPRLFNTAFGSGPRSLILSELLARNVVLPERGRLLDVGCSNGNLLRTFHAHHPQWQLYGSEISDAWKQTVLALPAVEDFYVGLEPVFPLKYDLLSLSHVAEHVPDPVKFFRRLSTYLTPNGHLLIASPNIRQNPIDLIIADHCTHFDENSLARALVAAGLEVVHLTTQTISKELVAVARIAASSHDWVACRFDETPQEICRRYFILVDDVQNAAQQSLERSTRFGVMGSSIAAAWLMQTLQGSVDFFVDEDLSRHGHELMGRPILGFADVPKDATVFIPMSAAVAEGIISRASQYPILFEYLDWNKVERSSSTR